MNSNLSIAPLLFIAWAAAATGCSWNKLWRQPERYSAAPQVFQAMPTRAEVIAAINANTQRVQTLQSSGTLSIPKLPSLTTEIVLERPRNFRFRAGTRFFGPELDLGSNQDLFWFWANQDPSHALYYARHEQYAASRARQVIPVEPAWVIEALGLVELDPQGTIEGPVNVGGNLQLRVRQPTSAGEVTKTLLVDAKRGIVLEQQVFDPRGQLLATAKASNHEFHQLDGVTLPHTIDFDIAQGQIKFQLTLDQHVINRPIAGGAAMFELPTAQLASAKPTDITDPNFTLPVLEPAAPVNGPPPRTSSNEGQPSKSRVRGFNPWR